MPELPETPQEYIEQFVYESDVIDGWTLTTQGDCDDFAYSMAYILSDKSYVRLIWNIATFKMVFHYVNTGRADHLVLYVRGSGYIENIHKEWFQENPFKSVFPWVILPPIVLIKVLIGWWKS